MNRGEHPVISVVMSVRNRAGMLGDCLQGLANQSIGRDAFEVIVIDNCSTEALEPVLERARTEWGLSIRGDRTKEDRGPAPARNIGVRMARGAVIAFTDSDCRPSPQWLERGVAMMRDEAVALASGPVLAKPEQKAGFTAKLSFVTTSEHPTYPTANLFVRREVFLALGGFNESLSFKDPFDRATECADSDLAWRIIEEGHERRFDADAIVHHEIENQTLAMWLLEPTRLFLLPELVRRHPQLRGVLLKGRYFFYPRATVAFAVVAALMALVVWEPFALVVFAGLLLGWGAWRTRSVDPRRVVEFCVRAPLHVLRLLILNMTLVYGSIRFRSLVL